MDYKRDNVYRMQVRRIKSKNGKQYYVVSDSDRNEFDVEMYPFQSRDVFPEFLYCRCMKVYGAQSFSFAQDKASLLAELFDVGEIYEFRVVGRNGQNYQLKDDNGFFFFLRASVVDGDLVLGSAVRCRVISINGAFIELVPAVDENVDFGMPFIEIEDLLNLDDCFEDIHESFRILVSRYWEGRFSEAAVLYDREDPLWVMKFVEIVDAGMADWLERYFSDGFNEFDPRYLGVFYEICRGLLEKSDYLVNCPKSDRSEFRGVLIRAMTAAGDFGDAVRICGEGRSVEFVSDKLNRLRTSGYLINPEKSMRVIMSIFTIKRSVAEEFIGDVYDIIGNMWEDEDFMFVFRRAFMEMLDLYIGFERRKVDGLTRHDLNADSNAGVRVKDMMKSLGVRILLGGEDDVDGALYRAMLRRYASLFFDEGELADSMLENACRTLFFGEGEKECGLFRKCVKKFISQISQLPVALCSIGGGSGVVSSGASRFDGRLVSVVAEDGRLTLAPQLVGGEKLFDVNFKSIMPKVDLCVMTNERLRSVPSSLCDDINSFAFMWKEIGLSLFEEHLKMPVFMDERKLPGVDGATFVKVMSADDSLQGVFHCVLCDPKFRYGRGVLSTSTNDGEKDVTQYFPNATVSSFRDSDNSPLILPVTVKSIDADGNMVFKMNYEIYDVVDGMMGESQECLVTYLPKPDMLGNHYATCVSSVGVGLSFRIDEGCECLPGDVVCVRLVSQDDDGAVHAEYSHHVGKCDYIVSYIRDAFHELMLRCCEFFSEDYMSEMDGEQEDVSEDEFSAMVLPGRHLSEYAEILGHYALNTDSQIEAFNYLSLACLISRIVEDEKAFKHFDRRRSIAKAVHYLSVNKRLDNEVVDRLLGEYSDANALHPGMRDKLVRLRVVGMMDDVSADGELAGLAHEKKGSLTGRLAGLVFAYNVCGRNHLYEQRQGIYERIMKELDVKVMISPDLKVVDSNDEDEHLEFKSSLFFPPKSKVASPDVQLRNVLKEVCAFMNSDGGTLYIGVNDSGYAAGMEMDFGYIRETQMRVTSSAVKSERDYFRLRFENGVASYLSCRNEIVPRLVSSSWLRFGSHDVFKVVVEKCEGGLVRLAGGERPLAFYRMGQSSRMLSAEEEKIWLK